MIESYKKVVFENYANFNGRARRSEYWYFILVQILIFLTIVILGTYLGSFFENTEDAFFIAFGFFALYFMAIIVPYLALVVRRLHDTGKSGWYFFVRFVPFIGGIWILILMCTEGNFGSNDYGPDPKNSYDEMEDIGEELI